MSILTLRNTFGWGTARIQQGLYKLPPFIREATHCVQEVRLSRETINNVLSKHGVNGYPRKHKRWKFFRAEKTDELWQIDFKGPFTVHGKKCRFLICIDDYSRCLVVAEQFNHEPKTKEVTALLEKQEASEGNTIRPWPKVQGEVEKMVQTARHRGSLCASILSSRQRQSGEMHTEPEQRVRQPPQEVPRMAERQTTRIQGMVQLLTVPQRNKHIPCAVIRV